MKRALLLVLLLLASAAFGDEQAEKRQLVSELLEVIDARGLMEGSFDNFVMAMSFFLGDSRIPATAESVPEEYRAQVEAEQRKEEEQRRALQTQLFLHIDYARYFDEIYVPTYTRSVPKADSWGMPYLYIADGEHYRLVSAGADKRFEWSSRHIDLTMTEPKLADSLDADIIFQDGSFLQSPQEAGEQ